MSTDYLKQLEEARKLASAAQARQQQEAVKYIEERCDYYTQRMAKAILENSHKGDTGAELNFIDCNHRLEIQQCVIKRLSPMAKCSIPKPTYYFDTSHMLECNIKEKKWYDGGWFARLKN
jgi:hypothetical protein